MLNHLFTRMYFPDEDNSNDDILNQLSVSDQKKMISKKMEDFKYNFDIFLQGKNETVFLNL